MYFLGKYWQKVLGHKHHNWKPLGDTIGARPLKLCCFGLYTKTMPSNNESSTNCISWNSVTRLSNCLLLLEQFFQFLLRHMLKVIFKPVGKSIVAFSPSTTFSAPWIDIVVTSPLLCGRAIVSIPRHHHRSPQYYLCGDIFQGYI